MKGDVKSSYLLGVGLTGQSRNAGAVDSAEVSHADYASVSFLVDVSGVGAAGTLDAKVQYKNAAGTWVDEPDTTAGNSTSITQLTAAGSALLHVVNPRGTASRVRCTVGTNAVVFGVAYCAGPKRSIAAP